MASYLLLLQNPFLCTVSTSFSALRPPVRVICQGGLPLPPMPNYSSSQHLFSSKVITSLACLPTLEALRAETTLPWSPQCPAAAGSLAWPGLLCKHFPLVPLGAGIIVEIYFCFFMRSFVNSYLDISFIAFVLLYC